MVWFCGCYYDREMVLRYSRIMDCVTFRLYVIFCNDGVIDNIDYYIIYNKNVYIIIKLY